VLARVRELGLDERTLVVFTSDNGPWYGGSSGGLRGMKSTTWEGGYRVPCIFRWPGHIEAGQVIDKPAVTMDVFATALAATGVAAPSDRKIDGRDLMPVLTAGGESPHEYIVGQRGPQLATIRDRRFKLHGLAPNDRRPTPGKPWVDARAPDGVTILAPSEQYTPDAYPGLTTGDEAKPMMLFDLENDPGEQHDVSASHPDVVRRLKTALDEAQNQKE
jgi:arylsulfatase A-like enzyme